MRLKVAALFFLAAISGTAQLMDSLPDVFRHRYSLDARLESRNSFIDGRLISVTGVRGGIAFQRKLRIGGGVSWLKTQVPVGKSTELSTSYLRFAYLCYYVDFVFYKTKHWQLSVPIQLGTGMSWKQTTAGYHPRDPKYFLLLYEPGITVQYKVTRWIGVGADIAYRFAASQWRKTGVDLNSPTYSFKLLFWADQLFFELFPAHPLSKRFGPAYW